MALNLNSSPYYDDFDSTKNYSRILFKPGVAVQARELTQLQTALSDQLGQLGSYTLKDGAIISGCEDRITSLRFVKITDKDVEDRGIDNNDLSSYIGATVTGSTTGLKAQIVDVRTGTTNPGDSPNTKTLYINYNDRAGTNVKVFAMGETLTVTSGDKVLNGKTFVIFDSGLAAPGSKERYEGSAPKIELSPGIIYARGNFIRTSALAAYIDPFIINSDKNIGFYVSEDIVQASDDETLRDPARGSYNENAPGADRLQIQVSLRSYNYAEKISGQVQSVVPENFYQFATWRNGAIVRSKIKTNPLAGVGDAIAKSVYNANGNYNITGLQTVIHEHLNDGNNGGFYSAAQGGDNSKFVFGITPGSANVGGYIVKQENKEWPIIVDKPTSTVTETSVAQSTAYGNYTLVDEFCGVWDVDGGGSVDLYDTAQDAVSGGTFSSTTILGDKIGSAKARFLKLDSGTAGTSSAQYRLYLYDIKMSSGTFRDVEGIVYENTRANGLANTVLNSAGEAVIQEGNYNRLVWELPYPSMKTLKAATGGVYNFTYKYIDEFDTNINAATGIVSLSSDSTQQTFFFGNGTVEGTLLTDNVQLLAVQTFTIGATTYAAGEYVDLTDASITVTQTSETEMSIAFDSAPGVAAAVRVYVNMQYSSGAFAPISKTLQEDKVVRIDTATNLNANSGWYCLGIADLLKIKSIRASTDSSYTSGAINITNEFIVDNGQRDNYYGLAKIKQKSNSTIDLSSYRYLTVVIDYLTSAENVGPRFACVDSYPSSLGLQEIPMYSPRAGNILDLRNCIDFRPYVVNTAVNASIETSATVNPSIEEVIFRPGEDASEGGLTNPVPTATFNTPLEYYLAQAFKVIVTQDGEFRVLTSQEANFPKFPEAPANSLTIAKGIIPPYPSLSPKAANYYKRSDLKVYLEQVRTKRYTMKDIGGLEERISNLEYYTSLSLLEKESKSVQILDTDGVDRFKNGLMIDAFNTYGVMAVGHDDNKCSLDLKKQQLRASFDSSIVAFKPIATETSAGQSGDIFHIPYVEAVYTKQLQASKSRNVVTELLYANPETTNPTTPDEPAAPCIATPPAAEEPVIPHKPVRPTEVDYYLIRSANTVAEGQSVTISIEVRNLEEAEGQTVAYEITGSSITAADLGLSSLSGNFTLDATGDSSLTLNVASDAVASDEVITLTLQDSGGNDLTVNGSVISTSITITDETVIVPPPPPVLGPYGGVLNLVPSEDSWFDDSYAEPAYQNKEGSWDNLEIQGDWKETWGSWELVSEDIIEATTENTDGEMGIPPKGYGGTLEPSSIDYETKAEGSGYWQTEIFTWTGRRQKYDITTTIAGKNTQTWERTGSRIFYGRIPDEVTERVGDSVINSEVSAFVRPITISGQVQALMPNAQHNIVMGGILKGTLTTNAAGRANFSISVNKGEFRCGNILVEIADSNKGDDVESYASSTFSSNGTKRKLQTTYVTTKWSQPPVGAVPLQETKEVILPVGEDNRTMTKKGDVIIDTHRETGDKTWIPVEDVFVTSSCVLGVGDGTVGNSISTYQRYDGTRYNVEAPSAACTPATDVITISTLGTTLNTSTNTIVDDDVIVTEVTLFDTVVNTNSNGGDKVLTVTLSNGAVLVADGLDEGDFVPGVTTTEGRYMMAYETAGIQLGGDASPYSVEINDITTDINLSTKIATAVAFDKVPAFKLNIMRQFNNICLFDDPLAQTFLVSGMPGGMFVPSVDIFFKTISSESNNNGITLEIREVINGYPSTTVVPNGATHLRRSDIFASGIEDDGTVKFNSTKFRFQNLVHLQNDKEYCIVLRPEANDPGYEVWVGELGQIQKNTTNRITKQAHGGVLFTSANNRTWTERQSEDLMFIVNRCKFTTNTDYVLNMVNKNIDWIVFDDTTWDDTVISGTGSLARISPPKFDSQTFIHSFTPSIDIPGSGYSTAVLTITGGGGTGATATATLDGNGAITGITITNPGTGYTSNPSVSVSVPSSGTQASISLQLNRAKVKYFDASYRTYEVEVTAGSFTQGDVVGDGQTFVEIARISDRVVDAHVLKCSTANAGEFGSIRKEISLTNTGVASANTTYSIVDTNSTVELKEEKTIYSYSNEVANYSSNKTAKLKFTISTPYNNLSPIIDIASIDMGVYKNKINNVSNEEVRFGGDADAKYISRQVVLADKQDAEDMRVFLDNAIPAGASVEVYGKFRNSEDDGEFANDIFWKKLEVETSPTIGSEKFGQYVYKIPAKGSSTSGTNVDGVFEYDVTRIDSIAVSVGGSGYSDTPPSVRITHTGNGYGAVAEAIVVGGVVTGIKITNPGRGYDGGTVSATISGGSGTGATAGSVTTAPVTFKTYKDFAIKIVHLSSNTARIPKSSGLRAYALQV
jgi:hypothetical protein